MEHKNICTKQILKLLNKSKFSRSKRLFVLSFENENDRKSHSTYYFPKVKIKDYNVMFNGKIFFYQPIKVILKQMKILEELLLVKEMINNRFFVRLFLFQRKLQNDCNRFK